MNPSDERAVVILNRLIAVCKDGHNNFMTAAGTIGGDPELVDLCLQYAQQRAEYADQLQTEVRRLSGEPALKGTLTGALHRGWMNMKALVTGGDEDAVIDECEAAELETKQAYQRALSSYLPPLTTQLLQKQYAGVQEVYAHFSSMKKATR